jgi:hypothetical protein
VNGQTGMVYHGPKALFRPARGSQGVSQGLYPKALRSVRIKSARVDKAISNTPSDVLNYILHPIVFRILSLLS